MAEICRVGRRAEGPHGGGRILAQAHWEISGVAASESNRSSRKDAPLVALTILMRHDPPGNRLSVRVEDVSGDRESRIAPSWETTREQAELFFRICFTAAGHTARVRVTAG